MSLDGGCASAPALLRRKKDSLEEPRNELWICPSKSRAAGGDGNVPDAVSEVNEPDPSAILDENEGCLKCDKVDLCSGVSPCKAALSHDDGHGLPTWSSMQSHSFLQWCSSLMRKALNSGTRFGAFLQATSQVVRAGRPVSAKALFPLPVPVPGVFNRLDGRPSAKRRHKRYFEQAFHVVIMALNYLHADFQFVDLKLLARPPNVTQEKALCNLKRILQAFGHSAGEISVPASGRRCTSLVSLLADLSEFLTKEGVADSAYHRGFPGISSEDTFPEQGQCGLREGGEEVSESSIRHKVVPRDLDRAPELVPYRDLDPSRLKLSGKAQWSPAPYLDDALWMAFQEPGSLRWTSSFNHRDLPDLEREDPNKVLQLARVWDVNGLLHLAPPLLEEHLVPSCLRVFNCYKSCLVDRQIGDRRGENQLEAYLPGPSRFLPCGYHLGVLEVDPTCESVVTCISDRRDFYHQLSVSRQRAATNKLWPPIPARFLKDTTAFEKYMAEHGRNKKKADRTVGGDRFADITRDQQPNVKLDPKEDMVFCCFNSVIQGDALGVEIATQGHRGLLEEGGLLDPSEELVSSRPFAGHKALQGLVIDDFFSLSIEKDTEIKEGKCSQAKKRFDKAQSIYAKAGLEGSADKDVVNATTAKIAGAELDSSSYCKSLGVIPLGAPASKRLALSFLSLELAKCGWSTDALHACLVGGWTSCLMFRRPLMSVFDQVYHCCDIAEVDQSKPRLFKLDRKVKEELTLISILAPLMCSDLATKTIPQIFATDASDRKGAFVSASVPTTFSQMMWRAGKRKGGYARMLSREKALLAKIDEFFEDGEDHQNQPSRSVSPEKPLAFRYHFLEICGGAGKIARQMAQRGWTVGPVIDLDRSEFFELRMPKVLSWLLFMLENGRLDSFLIAPPCTTFSPAQYPSLRSYSLPRGFDPGEERTLVGTTLALRALTLMMVASLTRAIGLLEQPRRSKMAWLLEWQILLRYFAATETHLASCSYGSIHQKEFRVMGVNVDLGPLYAPCTRDHVHVKVEGKYTKGTAVYTDKLASRFADVIEEAIRRKKSSDATLEPRVDGLESVFSNLCASSAPWKEEKSWRWKRSLHINILEASAYARLLYHLASKCPRSRFPVGLDSHVAMSAVIKGRSPSYSLRPVLRRIGATSIAGCLYPACHFFPTRLNPSDHPTRDTTIPPPAKSFIDFEADQELLLSLLAMTGLRRFAANWVRLILLMIGPGRAWSRSEESWRYTTWTYASYPFHRGSIRQRSQITFDQTLGYPGEGPFHGYLFGLGFFGLSVIVLPGFLLSAFATFIFGFASLHGRVCSLGLSSCSGGAPVLFCLLFVCLVCWGPQSSRSVVRYRLVFLVLVAPWHVSASPESQTGLARTPGDIKRAELRRGVRLEEGRPVLGKTKEARTKLLSDFEKWLSEKGVLLADLLHPVALDIDSVNKALEMFGRELHRSGRPYNHYAETINAVSALRPSLRRVLQGAWDLAFTWLREEPPTHHVAIPWQALLCLVSTAFIWNWPRVVEF